MDLIFGLDLGNGYVKIAGEDLNLVFPSGLVRVKETEKLMNGKNFDVFKVKTIKDEENEYFLGNDVEKMGDFIATNIGEGRYKDKYFKIIGESAIAYAIKCSVDNPSKEKHNVYIVAGLPSREKSAKVDEELKKALQGNHIVEIDGVEIAFEVKILKIIAQPLGTLFNYILNGNLELNEKYVGIIDCGTGTTDIDGIKELTVVDSDRDTFSIGSYEVYQRISDYVNKENVYANSTFKKIEEQFEKDVYRISDRALVDIADIKEQTVKNLSEDLINKISIRWQNLTKFDKIFLTGGSSSIFGEEIKKLIEDVVIVPNPQIANAQGFYKYAKFLCDAEICDDEKQ